ncbi:MAG: TetR/AcrR family transcriptional regulator [Streptosporangiaceae bacterium]|jgi:AcrR family transcriptional regulator
MPTDRAPPTAPSAPPPPGRTSDRGAATRTALLVAARETFLAVGYAQAGVTEIVARAGASIGSLYHHFAGKADLYLALFEELHSDQARRTRRAVRSARNDGVSDPRQLFLIGARAYLDRCVEQRELASLFVRGDGPPGFDLVMRDRLTEWVSKNAEFFARSGEPHDQAAAVVTTGALMLTVAEVALSADPARARKIADGVIEVLSRLDCP